MTLSPAQKAFRAVVLGGRRVTLVVTTAVQRVADEMNRPVPARLNPAYWVERAMDRAGAWKDEALAGLDQDGERRDPH